MSGPGEEPVDHDVAAAQESLTGYLDAAGIAWELGARRGEYVVTLPGEKKLRTTVSVVVGHVGLSASAFVIRNPDENHAQVYRLLLRRNLRMRGLAYGIDDSGDVYARGHLPLAGVDADSLDLLFGAVLEAADERFNDLLALGFLTSMKKEWAWRIATGESTANLEAFRHLLEHSSDDDQSGGPPQSGSTAASDE